MIKLIDENGRAVYVAPSAVAGIQEAGPSSSNTRSVVCLAGGKMINVRQSPAEIADAVTACASFDEWHVAKFGQTFESRALFYPTTIASSMRMLTRDLRDYATDMVRGHKL